MREDELKGDLRPEFMTGMLHELLPMLTDDELKRINVLTPGIRLQEDAAYVDIRDEYRQPFRAAVDARVEPGQLIVSKSECDYPLWNKLVLEPEDRVQQRAA